MQQVTIDKLALINAVKEGMEENETTTKDIAAFLDVQERTVRKWISGGSAVPSEQNCFLLAGFFGIPMQTFLTITPCESCQTLAMQAQSAKEEANALQQQLTQVANECVERSIRSGELQSENVRLNGEVSRLGAEITRLSKEVKAVTQQKEDAEGIQCLMEEENTLSRWWRRFIGQPHPARKKYFMEEIK